jgi:hypothetical protein
MTNICDECKTEGSLKRIEEEPTIKATFWNAVSYKCSVCATIHIIVTNK